MEEPHSKHLCVSPETDYKLCIKCQIPSGDIISHPNSYEHFLVCVRERAGYGDPEYLQLSSRLGTVSTADLVANRASWHRRCYQDTVHKHKIQRAKERFEKSIAHKDASFVFKNSVGRPPSSQIKQPTTASSCSEESAKKPFTRSWSGIYTKKTCLFCSSDDGAEELHEVCSFNVGKKIQDAVMHSDNDEWKVRLQSIAPNDARAIDIKYHLSCYVKNVQRSHVAKSTAKSQEQVEQDQKIILADIEFFNCLNDVLQSGNIISMNDATKAYNSFRCMHGVKSASVVQNRQLKEKIKLHVLDVEFSRPSHREAERICSKVTKDDAVKNEEISRDTEQDMRSVFDCANRIRHDILTYRCSRSWTFDGTLNSQGRDENIPASLKVLLRWIIAGPSMSLLTVKRDEEVSTSVTNMAQTIMYEVKSPRQVAYVPKTTHTGFRYANCLNEHVLAVGLKVHTYSRSKHLVNYLHELGISVNYNQILRTETQLAQAVIQRATETGGTYIPPGLVQGCPLYFALDNIDFSEDTHDGKNTLHGTVLVAFQNKSDRLPVVGTLNVTENASNRSLKNYPGIKMHQSNIQGAAKPLCSPKYPDHRGVRDFHNLESSIFKDKSWLLARYVNRSMISQEMTSTDSELRVSRSVEKDISMNDPSQDYNIQSSQVECSPSASDSVSDNTEEHRLSHSGMIFTWGAHNSLITCDERPLTNIFTLPLIPAPAHEWSTLITVLKQAQHISAETVGAEKKTIVTLDMDLYARALKLQSLKPEFGEKFILRVGEFHTVLCALRAIGSSVEASGIDDAWISADIYGPATTRQILQGRHMKRAVSAHVITLQVLFNLLLEEFQSAGGTVPDVLKQETQRLGISCTNHDLKQARNASDCLVNLSQDFEDNLESFCIKQEKNSPTFKAMRMYMDIVLILMQFIKASRQGDWILHLTALEKLCPYFFSQNRLKYAQHIPEYISKMYHLRVSDPDIWDYFMSGHFCVKKSELPFCSLGVDQALEQENRRLKVLGGLRGITQKPAALQRFFLIAPELQRLALESEKMAGYSSAKQTKHHEESQHVYAIQDTKVKKLQSVLSDLNPFTYKGTDLINVVTKLVVPDKIKEDILKQEQCGEDAYTCFVQKRILGDINLWDRISKVKLQLWMSTGKKTTMKCNKQTIELKENRSLFARMAIVSKSRPEIDMENAVGTYEFSCVARSLFTSDGTLLPCTDKHKLMELLENTIVNNKPEDATSLMTKKQAVIIDAMAIVQQIGSRDNVQTCKDIAKRVIERLDRYTELYNSLHFVFDHYDLPMSLKQQTRYRRMKVTTTSHYKSHICTDTTPVRTSMKQFLSSTKTKDNLTDYLSEKILAHYESHETHIVVSTQRGAKSNQRNVDELSSTQEEADTMLILHALYAVKYGSEVHIMSPDTDVFILAIRRLPELGETTAFITGVGAKRRKIMLKPIYDAIGHPIAAALPGFHAFTGCDNISHFNRKGKLACWKTLQKANETVVEAFIQLGTTPEISPETETALEEYVCQLYLPDTQLRQLSSVRWHLFKKSCAESEKLPPTRGTLRQHIKRSHFQAMVWQNDKVPNPILPSPLDYGWTAGTSGYIPVISDVPPAPKAVLELVLCKCSKGKCKTNLCSCRRANIACTEMCTCEGSDDICENSHYPIIDESDDSDEEV